MTEHYKLTPEQWATIRTGLLIAVQVACRQQYGVAKVPVLTAPQHVKELICDVFETIGYLEGDSAYRLGCG